MTAARKDILIVGGSKGGVGKSLVSMALLDHLALKQEPLLLLETDTSNPDVWKAYNSDVCKAYSGLIETELVDLDESDGWVRFVNLCDAKPDRTIVVNTAARNNKGVAAYGGTLGTALPELKRRLVTWWVVNRQRDSLELLKDFMATLPAAAVHVLRNSYFGEEAKFELYNSSKLRTEVEKRGGLSVTFPDLADRVADDLHSGRLAIGMALDDPQKRLPLGNRAELMRWRAEVGKVFGGLLNARA